MAAQNPIKNYTMYPKLMRRLAFCSLMSIGVFAHGKDYLDSNPVIIDSRSGTVPDLLQSPSLCEAPSGTLLAYYATSAASPNYAYIRASTDNGATWAARATLTGTTTISEASLFTHGSNVYLLGRQGPLPIILKSTDEGLTWTRATLRTGVNYSAGGMPVLKANGRIYLAWQDVDSSIPWPRGFRIIVCSVADTADFMDASNWAWSNSQTFPASPAVAGAAGWLEGNMVQGPDNAIWCIARVDEPVLGNTAAKFILSSPTTLGFYNRYAATLGTAQAGFFNLPGGASKFYIVRDAATSRYLMFSNPYCGGKSLEPRHPYIRNILALYESNTLSDWKWVNGIIKDDSRDLWADSAALSGFQYPGCVIKGNDLLCIARVAYIDSANYHDAKKITFHRIPNYAAYLSHDSQIAYYKFDTTNRGFDSSKQGGNKANGFGNLSLVPGKVGNAMSFNGTDAFFRMRYRLSSEMHNAPAVTVAFWMKNNTNTGSIFTTCISDVRVGTEVKLIPGKIVLGGRSIVGDSYQSKSFNFSGTGVWTHVTAVFDYANSDFRLYLNKGLQTGTGTPAFLATRYTVSYPEYFDSLGRHAANSAEVLYNGLLDDVKIYKRALTQAEINTL